MKILANDGLSQAGIDFLTEKKFDVSTQKIAQEHLIEHINQNQIKVLLVRGATKVRKDLIDACPSLKIIGRGGVGLDNIDVAYAREKGLYVIHTPSASSISVAELVFAHIFSMARMLHSANRKMPLEGETAFKSLKQSFSKGIELKGKTLGIIGFGKIGQEVAKIGLGVGMKVIMTDIEDKEIKVPIQFYNGQKIEFKFSPISMEQLISEADFISVNVPFLGKPLLTKEAFKKMKKGVGLVNASRGGIVHEGDLLEAIEQEKVAFAGLDVFENEPTPTIKLLMNDNISLSPHIGGSTLEAQERIGLELGEQIVQILG